MSQPSSKPALPTPEQAARDVREKAVQLNLAMRIAALTGLRVEVEVGEHFTTRERHLNLGAPTPELTVRVSKEM